jgi:hypothetical protein
MHELVQRRQCTNRLALDHGEALANSCVPLRVSHVAKVKSLYTKSSPELRTLHAYRQHGDRDGRDDNNVKFP